MKSKKFCPMSFLQNIEINCGLLIELTLDGFSNFGSFVFVLTFSSCCCYFIIYISIWSFFNIYIELNCYCNQLNCYYLNNSLSLNEYIYLKIQRAIPLDLAMLYRYCPLTKLQFQNINPIQKNY